MQLKSELVLGNPEYGKCRTRYEKMLSKISVGKFDNLIFPLTFNCCVMLMDDSIFAVRMTEFDGSVVDPKEYDKEKERRAGT